MELSRNKNVVQGADGEAQLQLVAVVTLSHLGLLCLTMCERCPLSQTLMEPTQKNLFIQDLQRL